MQTPFHIYYLIDMCGAYVPGCCCEGQRTTYSSFCPVRLVAWTRVIRPCHWPGFTARFTVRASRFLMKLSTFWPLILLCRINLVLKVYIVTPIFFSCYLFLLFVFFFFFFCLFWAAWNLLPHRQRSTCLCFLHAGITSARSHTWRFLPFRSHPASLYASRVVFKINFKYISPYPVAGAYLKGSLSSLWF